MVQMWPLHMWLVHNYLSFFQCQFPFTTGDRTNLKFVWDELMAGVQNYNTQVMGKVLA